MDAASLFFGLLWWLFGRSQSSPTPSSPREPWPERAPVLPAGGGAPPWPQVVPAGLPAFPGGGWEFDEPPPAAVIKRAGQLVSELWARGKGSSKIEQTAGRWIAYQAQIVASGKKGVVAYREKRRALPSSPGVAPAATATPASPRAVDPKGRPTLRRGSVGPHVAWVQRVLGLPESGTYGETTFAAVDRFQRSNGLKVDGIVGPQTWAKLDQHPRARAQPRVEVEVGPAKIEPERAPPVQVVSPVELPTLRRGWGMPPAPPHPDVKLLQRKLGIKDDGRFGPGTESAVKAFQVKNRLTPDGIVGKNTWAALYGGARA